MVVKNQDFWKNKKQKDYWVIYGHHWVFKTPLSKVTLLNILFKRYKNEWNSEKNLLVEDKFMSKMHLKCTGFTSSACGPFIKDKERI